MSPRCTTRWALSITMGGSCEDNVRRIYWRVSVKTQARDTRRSGSSNSVFLRRFGGVVGYRICLTHRRPPVRARAESFFFYPHSVFPCPPAFLEHLTPIVRSPWDGLHTRPQAETVILSIIHPPKVRQQRVDNDNSRARASRGGILMPGILYH